ncbi:MAG: DegT/DnrJ/EryC1/StrS family aminotransferase, partial [Candidatus Aenigmatarchaeota archaeon]
MILYRVPFLLPYWDEEELQAIFKMIFGEQSVRGNQIDLFEREVSSFINAKYVKAVNLGRAAIELGLRGLDLKRGEEVIIPSFVCKSAVVPIIKLGLVPVYAD